jgi:ferredoxin
LISVRGRFSEDVFARLLLTRVFSSVKTLLVREIERIAYRIVIEKCATVPWLCGDCRPECPNKAIGTAHVIDPKRCTECVGAYDKPNCAQICPADACEPDPEHPESKKQLLKKWYVLHPGEQPAPGTY